MTAVVLEGHPLHVLSPELLIGAMVTTVVFWILVERSANRAARKARSVQRYGRLSKPVRNIDSSRPRDLRHRLRRWMENDYVFMVSNALIAVAAAILAVAVFTILGTAVSR